MPFYTATSGYTGTKQPITNAAPPPVPRGVLGLGGVRPAPTEEPAPVVTNRASGPLVPRGLLTMGG
jgi:hypothetical protein